MAKRYLTSREVSVILDCMPDDVPFLAKRGLIKAHKPTSRWKYHRESVMAYKRRLDKENPNV